jgi:uncharacterized protein (TIGR03083 family)
MATGTGPLAAREWQQPELGAAHVREAVRLCVETLRPAVGRDWSVPAADLEWDCRRTLEHVADVLTTYATRLAVRAPERLPSGRTTDPTWSVADVLAIVEARAVVLAEVIAAAPPEARAWHSLGMADPSGWAAMACDELIAHTDDVARGLNLEFNPPPELLERVIARLFPWAPAGFEPFQTFRWCNGRAPLGELPRQDKSWGWHCAPLSEWDGSIRTFQP